MKYADHVARARGIDHHHRRTNFPVAEEVASSRRSDPEAQHVPVGDEVTRRDAPP